MSLAPIPMKYLDFYIDPCNPKCYNGTGTTVNHLVQYMPSLNGPQLFFDGGIYDTHSNSYYLPNYDNEPRFEFGLSGVAANNEALTTYSNVVSGTSFDTELEAIHTASLTKRYVMPAMNVYASFEWPGYPTYQTANPSYGGKVTGTLMFWFKPAPHTAWPTNGLTTEFKSNSGMAIFHDNVRVCLVQNEEHQVVLRDRRGGAITQPIDNREWNCIVIQNYVVHHGNENSSSTGLYSSNSSQSLHKRVFVNGVFNKDTKIDSTEIDRPTAASSISDFSNVLHVDTIGSPDSVSGGSDWNSSDDTYGITYPYRGKLGPVMVWNKILSKDEVEQVYSIHKNIYRT